MGLEVETSSSNFRIKPYKLIECKYNTDDREVVIRYVVTPCKKCFVVGVDIAKALFDDQSNDEATAKTKEGLEKMEVDYGHCLAETLWAGLLLNHQAYTEEFVGGFAFGSVIVISLSVLRPFIQNCSDARANDQNASFLLDFVEQLEKHVAYLFLHNRFG